MDRKRIEEFVEQLAAEIINNNTADGDSGSSKEPEIEIVDVEYVKERDWYLRVFVDKENGIELDDCQWISERLEERLDQLDVIKEKYYLEVSSPGLDRQLKKEKDFLRHIGDMVEIKLYRPVDGKKDIAGKLLGLKDGIIHIKDPIDLTNAKSGKKDKKGKKGVQAIQTEELAIPWNEAAKVSIYIDF